jgi:CheY-like chemotaxis protein
LRRLIAKNHDIVTCDNGASAIAHLKSGHFDVALIDFGLPGQRGDTVAQALKAKDANLVTVLITGWHLEKDDPCLTAFDFHIKKPFVNSNAISDILSQALALHD